MWLLTLINVVLWIIGFVFLYRSIGQQQQMENRLTGLERAVEREDAPGAQ